MGSKPLRVLAVMDEDLVPPPDVDSLPAEERDAYRTERDVLGALRALGHDVAPLGLQGDLTPLRDATKERPPDVVFNLLEEFRGETRYDYFVVSDLESARIPYTGCNPRGLILARDKALAKKVLHYHRIRTPDFAVFPKGRRPRRPRGLGFPLIVKSLVEEASLGIAQASIVEDDARLAERVAFVHEHVGTDALAESFIEGRELYVGVLGTRRLTVLPVWELQFAKMPADAPRIATHRAKWNRAYQRKWGIDSAAAQDLPDGVGRRIADVSRRAYRALGLSGYARIDFRMTPAGDLHLLEANPNPQIARDEDFAASAAAAGLPYEALVGRLLSVALEERA
jgi:D-alanine-D-alanine ligase